MASGVVAADAARRRRAVRRQRRGVGQDPRVHEVARQSGFQWPVSQTNKQILVPNSTRQSLTSSGRTTRLASRRRTEIGTRVDQATT